MLIVNVCACSDGVADVAVSRQYVYMLIVNVYECSDGVADVAVSQLSQCDQPTSSQHRSICGLF